MRYRGGLGNRHRGIALAALALFVCIGCGDSASEKQAVTPELRNESVAKLREVMQTQERWVKVHAAEWLLELGYPQGVAEEFRQERTEYGDEPEYRIGIWRVLAKVPQSEKDKEEWTDKIKTSAIDPNSPDRVHATESLAKLGVSLDEEELQSVTDAAKSADARLAAYSRWLVIEADEDHRETNLNDLIELLDSPDVEARRISAYALQHLGPLDETNWSKVVDKAKAETDPLTRIRLQGAALPAVTETADNSERDAIYADVLQTALQADSKLNGEVVRILADVGHKGVIELLERHLRPTASADSQDGAQISATVDLSAAAANAILRIDRRNKSYSLHEYDWAVIGGYALMMLCVGLYYSRRTMNREDYLLGGRTMRPWMVGISLFATIISTISYLAYPGEMIHYGPMIFASIFALPIAYFVVGYWLIPSLMSLSGTSGYSLLENKLGVSVRLLGASVFLTLRLVWMATIIYATAKVALLPVMGIDESYLPVVCILLGVVTLGYTSMGGLRAVVMTDVIQSFILFGGAFIALFLVTYHFGGLQWFPTEWVSHWPEPNYGLGFQERMTVFNVIISILAWFICTCGSDQMAIQRYLATRDPAAARRSFRTSLIATFAVKVLLAIVGLAVMAYFSDLPELLPDRMTILSAPDEMFPRFIVVGIPKGLTGLVVSGMLAAAMSSLSSGISASTSVISDDFIKRFRGLPADEHVKVSEERVISVVVGVLAVSLSLAIGYVPGNLLEITTRLVNAPVGPLFVLFFMAIFVPWATSFGTIVGFVAGATVAVAISLFGFLGMSMMWIVPGSMIVGIVAGCVASLLPIGRRAP